MKVKEVGSETGSPFSLSIDAHILLLVGPRSAAADAACGTGPRPTTLPIEITHPVKIQGTEEAECRRCGERTAGDDACLCCGLARTDFPCESHPDEPAVGRCVICNRPLCEECQSGDGRTALCGRHSDVVVIQGWAQVYSTTREFTAALLVDNLEIEGIDARIFSQRDNMFSVDVGELSIVRLLVPAWEYTSALKIIRDHMNEQGEVIFACPECGEAYEPGAASCEKCGNPLPRGAGVVEGGDD